jgi:hypothetical protein
MTNSDIIPKIQSTTAATTTIAVVVTNNAVDNQPERRGPVQEDESSKYCFLHLKKQ